jgi:hypothetical protein
MPMNNFDTLASVGYRARRIEPAEGEQATRADIAQAACQCTTFLDQCAAEAFAARWFPRTPITMRRRSCVVEQVLDALRDGPLDARQIMPRIGHERSATEKALRELLEDGRVVVVARRANKNGARVYGLPEASDE